MTDESSLANASSSDRALVDPRVPRFGQLITATVLLGGVILNVPALIYFVALILGTSVLSRWRVDLYAFLWRHIGVRIVGRTDERESAIPHRFAKLLGAVGTTLASVLLLAGLSLAGTVIAIGIGLLAALGGLTGYCLGCKMYRQVSFLHRRGVV